jgi:WD40 repeat protein
VNDLIFPCPVHVDAQGLVPVLPDAHAITFPLLTLPPPPLVQDSGSPQAAPDAPEASSYFALFEVYIHRLFAITSIPVDLLIPPYSTPLPLQLASSQHSKIAKMAMHPELPVVAIAQAQPGGFIFLFDLRTNQYLKYKLTLGRSQYVNTMAFSKYNLFAVGTSDGELLVYELNLSIQASTTTKQIPFSAVPQFASLLPPQFPRLPLLGEITDVSFDRKSGRYLAISTTRSGTWIYDTVHSSPLRLSKYPSAAVAFSPSYDFLAVSQEKTGIIEFYELNRAGTLTFGVPTYAKSGENSTVTNLQWSQDGKILLYSNYDKEGIRMLRLEAQTKRNPGKQSGSSIADLSRHLRWKHRYTGSYGSGW